MLHAGHSCKHFLTLITKLDDVLQGILLAPLHMIELEDQTLEVIIQVRNLKVNLVEFIVCLNLHLPNVVA